MTTALPPNSETRVAHSQVELALTLELEPDSANALLRTLVLLHRRCCRVTEAEYRLGRGTPTCAEFPAWPRTGCATRTRGPPA